MTYRFAGPQFSADTPQPICDTSRIGSELRIREIGCVSPLRIAGESVTI